MNEIAIKVSVQELIEKLSTKKQLYLLEAYISTKKQAKTTLSHQFEDGIYMRELTIPAGALCTTYVHKTNNMFFIFHGELLIWDEKSQWEHLQAFHRGKTKKGTKRIIYALDNVLWVTVHPNPDNCRDIEILESRLFEKSLNPFLSLPKLKQAQK